MINYMRRTKAISRTERILTLIKSEIRAATRDKIENPDCVGISPEAAFFRERYLELMTPEERKTVSPDLLGKQ
jgi:hypothetical protein